MVNYVYEFRLLFDKSPVSDAWQRRSVAAMRNTQWLVNQSELIGAYKESSDA